MSDAGPSVFFRRLLVVREGTAPLHELTHYWDHVGTTFGAIQLLFFIITGTHVRKASRLLAKQGKFRLPLVRRYGRDLPDENERTAYNKAFSSSRLLGELERSHFDMPKFGECTAPDSVQDPWLDLAPGKRIPVGAALIQELHAHAIDLASGHREPAGFPVDPILALLGERLGNDAPRAMCFLCDWALMAPHPQAVPSTQKEIRPGWRFLSGFELLRSRPLTDVFKWVESYQSCGERLATELDWNAPAVVMRETYRFILDHCERYQPVAAKSWRHMAYLGLADCFRTAQAARTEAPDAFALTYLHRDFLLSRLPPLARIADEGLVISDPNIRPWLIRYLKNSSMISQLFGSEGVRCLYRHIDIPCACPFVRDAAGNTDRCFTFPAAGRNNFFPCGFLKNWQVFGLPLDAAAP